MASLTEFIGYLHGVLMQAWFSVINIVMPKSCDNHWHWFEITNNNEIVEALMTQSLMHSRVMCK